MVRVPVRVAAAVCALALAAAGCGRAHPDRPAGVADTEARLTALYQAITGGPAQRSAAEYVGYRILQDQQYRCVRRHGFRLPVPSFTDEWSGRPVLGTGTDTRWLAPLNSHYLLRVYPYRGAHPDGGGAPDPYPTRAAAYNRALAACPAPLNAVDRYIYPTGYGLTGDLQRMVDGVDRRLDHHQLDYQDCMHAAGLPMRSYRDFDAAVARPLDRASTAAARQVAVAYEARAVAADGRCRRAAHDEGFRLLAPRLARFQREHAATLAALHGRWRATVRTAARYRAHPLRTS